MRLLDIVYERVAGTLYSWRAVTYIWSNSEEETFDRESRSTGL